MKKYYIYKLTNQDDFVYIGATSNIMRRFNSYYNNQNGSQKLLNESLLKYGFSNHRKEILFTHLTREESISKEVELIALYKEKGISLNIANGGLNGSNLYYEENSLSKPIIQFDLSSNIIKRWSSASEIYDKIGLNKSNIGKVCRNKTHYQHGFLWCFESDYKNGIIPIYENKIGKNASIKVIMYNDTTSVEYSSVKEAIKKSSLLNAKRKIYNCLKNNICDDNGFYWKYKNIKK